MLLNEILETQNIDTSKIICNICNKNNLSLAFDYSIYKCLTCGKNICSLCKTNHDIKHKLINYEENHYICEKHNEEYISYCSECKLNLCSKCEIHENHERILFSHCLPDNEELNRIKRELNLCIQQFNNEINSLINLLNDVKKKMNIFYKINEHIISSYNKYGINYEKLYNINGLLDHNIINELNKVINCNNIIDKFIDIFNIYKKMNINEINLIYKVNNEKEISLFGEDFVKLNRKNCKLFIDGKEKDLKEKYTFGIFSSKKNLLEIKLKGITNVTKCYKYELDFCWM